MVVTDETVPMTSANATEPDGIVVNIFRPSLNDFPRVEQVGSEIVQFRHFRIQKYQANLQAVSARWSAWTVFYRELGEWKCRPERHISVDEIGELDHLISATDDSFTGAKRESLGPDELPKKRARALQTIASLEENIFFDLVAEVVEIPEEQSEQEHRSFYVMDYTTDYRLLIIFWDNFKSEIDKLVVGDLIQIAGLHCKAVEGQPDRLMGVLHGDANWILPKVKKIQPNSPLVQELLKRKERHTENTVAEKQVEDMVSNFVLTIKPLPNPTKVLWKNVPVTPIDAVLSHPKVRNPFVRTFIYN